MTRKEDHNMTRLVSPQATPQDIENRLAQKADFIKNATEVWGDVLSLRRSTRRERGWLPTSASTRRPHSTTS